MLKLNAPGLLTPELGVIEPRGHLQPAMILGMPACIK
jgi:hypothetical protein